MKMLNTLYVPKLVSKKLFSILLIPALFLPVSLSQAEEPVIKPQSDIKFYYPSYSLKTLLESEKYELAKASSDKPSKVQWLLDNSVIEDGIYSLEFKPNMKGQYGGGQKGKRGVWENLRLKLSLDVVPKPHYHTSLPWLYSNDMLAKNTRTHFRANRSTIKFSISGEWY